jgi:hypothetical protein
MKTIDSVTPQRFLNQLPTLLFFAIAGIYIFFWARVGLDTKDGGFILSLSWRILNGETPYQDFLYIRPPLGLYIHALPLLAENYGIYADRVFCIFQLIAVSLLGASIVLSMSKFQADNRLFWWLSTAVFVFSAHNFPFFGWHTVDGIFFSVLALYALTKRRSFAAGLIVILAVASKQNFAAVAFLLAAISAVLGPRQLTYFLIGMTIAVVLGVGWLQYVGILPHFVSQVLEAGKTSDIVSTGLLGYLHHVKTWHFIATVAATIGALMSLGVVMRLRKNPQINTTTAIDAYSIVIILSCLLFAYTVIRKSLGDSNYEYFFAIFFGSKTLFLASCFTLCILVFRERRNGLWSVQQLAQRWLPFAGMLGIAWTTSISWGYAIPALFAAPLIGPLVLLTASSEAVMNRLKIIVAVSIATFSLALAFPYGEGVRIDRLVRTPSDWHAASLLWTNTNTIEKVNQINDILLSFDNKAFAVMPGFTNIHLLMNDRSPSLLDWEMNAEIPHGRHSDVVKHLCQEDALAIVEKDRAAKEIENPGEISREDRFASGPTAEIVTRWRLAQETEQFLVFQPTIESCK